MSSLSAAELFNVKGMVFVITGGGTGIGLMMAKGLAENGAAKVYILGRRLEKLQEVAKSTGNGRIIPIEADVTSKSSLEAAASQVERETGFVNAVIANSGISGPSVKGVVGPNPPPSIAEVRAKLLETPMEDFTNTFNTNTTAVFYTMVAFLQLLDSGNSSEKSPTHGSKIKSQFIATASIGAFNRRPLAGFAYSSSKAAVVHLIKQLATWLVPYQIRANVICPGVYPSEMLTSIGSGEKDMTEEGSCPPEFVPATRAGATEDMAGTILHLCSRAGAYCNGNVVITDGGRLSVVPATY